MSIRVALTHAIARRFVRPVTVGTHWLRLRPVPHARARIDAYALNVRTEPHFVNWTRDAFGNHVARLDLPEPVMGFALDVDLVATLADASPFDFLVDADAMEHPYGHEPQLEKELAPYLHVDAAGPRLAAWTAALDRSPRYVVDRLAEVTQAVHATCAHDPRDPGGVPDVEVVLARGAGTAADLAWLLTLGLRALGIAARVASGYHVTVADGAATARLHAWSEAFVPGAGWIGLDPAAGLFATAHYVPLACAADPLRARPVLGFREWCEETAQETIVARVLAAPDAAWPYPAPELAAMRVLADAVDARLASEGVQLAVGRELAFVSSADAGLPEWSTAALGASKLATAHALVDALHARLLPGAAVQASSAEWYAGDPMPRWRLVAVARTDGRPVWRDAALRRAGRAAATIEAADTLAETLARALGVDPRCCLRAYDDPLARTAPGGVAPPSSEDLHDPERRRRLADGLSARLCRPPVGVVLPLGRDADDAGWRSGAWRFRRDRLYLLDGTLPMGFRLPLESLPVVGAPPPDVERCGFRPLPALGDFHAPAAARLAAGSEHARADGAAPRTAVCVELRDGRLCVFLPPLVCAEHYLGLVAAIEVAAAATGMAVAIEGYEPPEDRRLRTLAVEPDVGVLRVTLPGAVPWSEHAAMLETTYAEADALGLVAERRSPDGVREPVGAVAPLVLGGPGPDESPLLDRPELLRALVAYWQRHPCLSYLFAARFVGPSGTAVRPDEGRDDALHELTIALERMPAGPGAAPWLADRLLRHLLADRIGDMGRAEIRVDRLYDPVRASRRLGRVAIRSFDTAPVAAMAAVEALLVRALVARFAHDGAARPLVRHGAGLHDRFLLPTVLWHDLHEVLADLRAAGFAFEPAWIEPFRELHFPLLGHVQIGDAALALRPAHEPWPVLAEETTGAGMARFVDTANERLEVRATGLTPGRHVLACNGRRVPLRPTPLEGEWVAGVRYKRWNPVATLHPTTSPVGELVFDLIDAWTGRAIGGCRFVPSRPTAVGPVAAPFLADATSHDGGGPPRLPPVAAAPQADTPGRFFPGGSGLGPMTPPPAEVDAGHLLDLTIVA